MEVRVDIRTDNSERVKYNKNDFPACIKHGVLSTYPNYAAVSHWHDDVEFIAVTSGHMMYNVNGEIVQIDEGNGIFVNARQVHFGYSDDHSECIFICILLHPMALCASRYLEQKYIIPVLSNRSMPYLLLHQNVNSENKILLNMCDMYKHQYDVTAELKIENLFFSIWEELFIKTQENEIAPPQRNHHLTSFKDMIAYIEGHYKDKISLIDIAKAGNVGKTGCCNIFRKFINQTPNAYLTDYRLRKGAELLTVTDMTVSEICYEVGFSGASYFTEMFHKYYGQIPTEYRLRS